MTSPFAHVFHSAPAPNTPANAPAAQRRLFRLRVAGAFILLLAGGLIAAINFSAARQRDAVDATAGQVYADHHLSRTRPRISALINSRIYNLPHATLNESIVLSMRVQTGADLAARMGCEPPGRPEFKTHVTAPTFDTQTALDDTIVPHGGIQWFEWILTGKQVGLQEVHVRGILFCALPGGGVTTRQTVVDQIRGIVIGEPFVLSSDNVIALTTGLLTLLGSGGILTFLGGVWRAADAPAAAGNLRGDSDATARLKTPDGAASA